MQLFGGGPEKGLTAARVGVQRSPEKGRRPTNVSAVGGRQQTCGMFPHCFCICYHLYAEYLQLYT